MSRQGRILIITGEGKGKTTSALGLAWQAVGRGERVLMIQFLKAPDTSGEHFAADAFGSRFVIKPMGRKGFISRRGPDLLDRDLAHAALEEARKAFESGRHNVIILDEVNVAVHLGLLEVGDLLGLIESKPKHVELVLTGRYAPTEVVEQADAVLEMRNIKHHFDAGLPAREGIEY
jgi:cob(I)alamin adenosyltransferase